VTPESGGGLWRLLPDGSAQVVVDTLPCCFGIIGSQPNGLIFGPDGYLYLTIGALTDHLEPPDPQRMRYAELHPLEASILRIHPHTGDVEVYARGLRDPYDLTFDSSGQFYATDNGIVEGPGDRLLKIDSGKHYGWPYWRERGCWECPLRDFSIDIQDDLLSFPDYTLPRGLTVYTGTQFPANMFDDLFVVLWNGTSNGQRVVRIDLPSNPDQRAGYLPEPFVTGLIRPVDVVVAPDGSLVIADFIYGHVWRVQYIAVETEMAGIEPTISPTPAPFFVTSTPRP
jgi:glucose/arabinose dehydrogenase